MTTELEAPPVPAPVKPSDGDERVTHLVMKGQWPTALCGATVSDLFNKAAPAMDRCHTCLKIASDRGLKLTGWSV